MRALGKGDFAQRLLGSLAVDIAGTRSALGWFAAFFGRRRLALTAASYLSSRTGRKRSRGWLNGCLIWRWRSRRPCSCGFPLVVLVLLVRLTSPGKAIYWSDRVGQNNRIFRMPKLRTMRVDTPAVATHLLADPDRYITPIGKFLRASSLDELPQLWSISKGDMSAVGPRPALYNQDDLIALRTEMGVHLNWCRALPAGRRSTAATNWRSPTRSPSTLNTLKRRSLCFDCEILWKTALKVLRRDGVAH